MKFLTFPVVGCVCGFYVCLWFFVSRIVLAFAFHPILLWSGYNGTHWEICTFLWMLHNTFSYKEIGHLGSKDVKAESALDRYPDIFGLEIEQEQASYKFLLPLCVSQIKSAVRVTSLTIFLSHIFFFSCFFHFIFCIFLKGEGSQGTIYYFEMCIMYAFDFCSQEELVHSNFPVYEIIFCCHTVDPSQNYVNELLWHP